MANIAFPSTPLGSVDISLEWPGQSVFQSLYTSDRHVYTRGVGLWAGQIIWPQVGRIDNANAIKAIEVFLHQLEGAANTFDVPIPVEQTTRFATGFDLRATAVVRTGSTMRLACNHSSGLFVGDFITIDNYLFQLISNLNNNSMQVTPYRPIDVTVENDAGTVIGAAVNWSNPTLRARRTDASAISNRMELDWAGPWTLQIVGA